MPRPRLPSRPATALATATALVLAGCGGGDGGGDEKTLDASELPAAVSAQYERFGATLRDVSCAPRIRKAVGATVSCRGTNAVGSVLDIRVTVRALTGDDVGKARLNIRTVGGALRGTAAADAVRKAVERGVGGRVRGVTCPDPFRIPTRRATCVLTVPDGRVYDVAVSADALAKFRIRVADEPRSGG